jgi:hypothetical protein
MELGEHTQGTRRLVSGQGVVAGGERGQAAAEMNTETETRGSTPHTFTQPPSGAPFQKENKSGNSLSPQ